MFSDTFYPTPQPLIDKMIAKIQGMPGKVLEPSAGKGDIVERLSRDTWNRNPFPRSSISTIEENEELQATLRGKGFNVIDSDFLSYSGPDKFDLIIANPPFDTGDCHLLKAIDIMYRGEIIFLLNAETLRNPYTNTRKELAKKLGKLDAEVEYIPGAFKNAERSSGVEVALVYINIKRQVEDDLFKDVADKASVTDETISQNHEVSNRRAVEELVAEYNQVIGVGTETIVSYYRNFRKIGKYISLNKEPDKYSYGDKGDMTDMMQNQVNSLLVKARTDFWRRTLNLHEVRNRMTAKKQSEFESHLSANCFMDFTEKNIRQFVLNLIGGYEKTLIEAVLEVFDKFTVAHSYSGGLYEDNIHYFNGWKTNKAFKVGKKVIIPIYAGYGKGPFCDDYSGKWKLQYGAGEILRDIDVVMNYFDGLDGYLSINNALEYALDRGQNSKIHSTYFTLTAYKKGTLHLTFNDEGILRRFNIAACRGKAFLPHDYGSKHYKDMPQEEQSVVNAFEGVDSYNKNRLIPLFAARPMLALEAA